MAVPRRSGAAGSPGQALVWFALFLPGFILGLLLLFDYLVTTRDALVTAAALDLAVHAGVQAGWADDRGRVAADPAAGEAVVRAVFAANNRAGAELTSAACGGTPPTCRARARVYSRGLTGFRHEVAITAEATGTPGIAGPD